MLSLRSFRLAVILSFLAVAFFAAPLLAQEAPTGPGGIGSGALQYGLSELLKWGIPALGALLFSAFNKAESALAGWNNWAKRAAYVGLTTVLFYVGEFVHVAVSADPANWTGTFWESLAAGIVGTFLVKLGITQVRDPASATAR